MKHKAFLGRIDGERLNYVELIREGLRTIGFADQLPSHPRIFLKPNLTFPVYRPGVMTSPEAVEAAIQVLAEYEAKVWVGDADSGGYNPFSMHEVYKKTGIASFAPRYGAEVVNLSDLPRRSISFDCRGKEMTLALPRLLTDEIDALITLPVPKIHMNTGVSLTFKNQWGCIPEPEDRLRLHPYFKETVQAVNAAVGARFAIIDGRYGLNATGPMRGEVVELNWLCVTDHLGAGARIACSLMGIDPLKIKHLRYARTVGNLPDLDQIDLNRPLDDFRGPTFYLKRSWTDYPGFLAFNSARLAHLAYFSRWSKLLHKILYLFREPFYDYEEARRVRAREGVDSSPERTPNDSDGSVEG